ncbi:murein L,D-transpeptidase catalytic domain family protein [Flectobacillus major]|uniref:murein L,D-transpeptidase catalytic domain family protein n=1 Tax=Flectobacillus major TaxID=103 RepID=UPI0006943D5C|nr:murein L,D-transpeptidase catalytic domain family protein [Flectobacillus major]
MHSLKLNRTMVKKGLIAFLCGIVSFGALAKDDSPATPAYLLAKAKEAIQQYDKVNNRRIACIVDFSKPSFEKRLWIVDLVSGICLLNTWVAHGKGSGRSALAESFSNDEGSLCSSLGIFIPTEQFHGKHGLSLRLLGLNKGLNDKATQRGIIFHAADYVSEKNAIQYKRQGNSFGCFAVTPAMIGQVVSLIKPKDAFILAIR